MKPANVPSSIRKAAVLVVSLRRETADALLARMLPQQAEQIRQAAGTAAKLAEKSKFQTLSFYLPDGDAGKVSKSHKGKSGDRVAGALAEGAHLALYHFDNYKSVDEENPVNRIQKIVFLAESKA